MKKREKNKPELHNYSDMTVPAFGYELLREALITEIHGKETEAILYWCGRNLARKYPLESFESMTNFFQAAGWGNLTLTEEGKTSLHCSLSSDLLSERTNDIKKPGFSLESGFLAEQIQSIKKRPSESHFILKKGIVKFVVEWDHKDRIASDSVQS